MNPRIAVGLLLLVINTVGIVIWQGQVVTVKGYTGGSKVGLFEDPNIKSILSERYQIRVEYVVLGSLEQVIDVTGQDFLWPGNELVLERYREKYGRPNYDVIFHSPLVFYSWDVVTDALVRQGLVEQIDNVYYVTDMPRFARLLIDGREWKEIGLPMLRGNVAVITSDPTKSNSGNVFAGMLAQLLLGGKVADVETIELVLPDVKKYFRSLGHLEPSTGQLFDRFVRTGMGDKPIIVAYESQIIDLLKRKEPDSREQLQHIRILYPRPTAWGAHPLIAVTRNGERLQKALQDQEIQNMARDQHGFRTGTFGSETPPRLGDIGGIAPRIDAVMPVPQPRVMDRLTAYLSQ